GPAGGERQDGGRPGCRPGHDCRVRAGLCACVEQAAGEAPAHRAGGTVRLIVLTSRPPPPAAGGIASYQRSKGMTVDMRLGLARRRGLIPWATRRAIPACASVGRADACTGWYQL